MELNKHFARSALKDIEVLCCVLEPTMELNKLFARSVQANIENLYIRSYGQTASVTSKLRVHSRT